MCVCVSALRLLIASGMIWTPIDWLNKLYSFYVAAIVNNISKRGLTIEVRHKNQPNKRILALYKPLLYIYSNLKQLYISKRQSTSGIKMGVTYMGIHILRCLKEWLA